VKLAGRGLEEFLSASRPPVSPILIYGPDQGLVRERARVLMTKCVADLRDPFAVCEFTGAQLKQDPASLSDAACGLSLTGGNRVIWVREAGDSLTDTLQNLISGDIEIWPIVVEAGELAPRSSLRRFFETNAMSAAIACYADEGRGLERIISETLAGEGLQITREALSHLSHILGGDRLVIRGELEKLALYVGASTSPAKTVTDEDVLACIGDSSNTSLDSLVFAVADGNQAIIDVALAKSFAEGQNAVTIIRAVQRHLHRLHLIRGQVDAGMPLDAAMAALRPPVFYKWKDSFQRQARNWQGDRLGRALVLATECEIQCKTTGMPDQAVCSRALMRIAQGARSR